MKQLFVQFAILSSIRVNGMGASEIDRLSLSVEGLIDTICTFLVVDSPAAVITE